MVSGVSGAGKSSLLRAGMLPRLVRDGVDSFPQSQAWPRLLFPAPGRAPLAELAAQVAVLARTSGEIAYREMAADPSQFAVIARQAALVESCTVCASRVILVIDQLEQLFTQDVDEAQRRAYVGGADLSGHARDCARRDRGAGGLRSPVRPVPRAGQCGQAALLPDRDDPPWQLRVAIT